MFRFYECYFLFFTNIIFLFSVVYALALIQDVVLILIRESHVGDLTVKICKLPLL